MSPKRTSSYTAVLKENQALRMQLDEAREALQAIRTGGVDAVLLNGSQGEQVYTLQGADHPYRIFVESMNEGAVTIDVNGIIVYANRLFADLISVPLERTIGTAVQQFVSPPDRSQWEEVTDKAKGQASRGELSLISAVGETIPILLSVQQLPMEPERFYCCIVTDLRGQRIREQFQESASRLQKLLRQSPAGIVETDATGRMTLVNQRWCEMLGYTEGELLQMSVMDVTDHSSLEATKSLINRLIEGAQQIQIEKNYRRKDGSVLTANSMVSASRDQDGTLLGLVAVVLDITARKQTEDRLRESEARFRQLSTSLPLLAWTCLPNGLCDFLSQQWVTYTGIPEAEQLGYGWLEQLHPDDRDRTVVAWNAAVEADSDFHWDFCIRRYDGEYRWFESKATPVRDEQGKTVKWFGFNSDVTERRRAEEALKENEERFRTLADNMSQFAWMADADGSFFWYNRRWFDYTGTTLVDMNGWGWQKVHHPDHLHRVIEKWRQAVETKTVWGDTFPLRAKDGSYRWFLSCAVPIRDGGGNVVRWFGTNTDITELREAEENLATLASIVRSSDDAMFSVSPGGFIMSWNRGAERLFGYTAEEAIGRSTLMLIPPERYGEGASILSRIRRNQSVEHHETVRCRKDGTLLDVSITVSPIKDEQGQIVGASKVVRDITERKRQEEELRRWKDTLEQRVAERTQELKLSQARLRAMASELNLTEQRERKRLAAELHDHLQQILVFGKLTIGNSKRQLAEVPSVFDMLKKLDDIFSDALTYTRTLVTELSPSVLRDHGLAVGLKWLTEHMRNKHAFAVTVMVPDDSELHLPEDHVILLFQSVRELLINAAKHAGTGTATVQMDKRDGQLIIDVCDEGAGFDLAVVAEAGSPSGGISSKFGLFSIQERMRALGGAFELHSEPGKGTTARLLLPLPTSGEGKEPEANGSEAVVPMGERAVPQSQPQERILRVLLVDDHAMVRQGLRSMLEIYTDLHVIGEAGNGTEAIRLTDALQPHVVVMDINMPKMNGIEATEQIKSHWPEITVVGISVNTGDENCQAMMQAGAVTVLPKEAAVEQLHETIVRAVATVST
ncbi:MAG TPA: PAS domain S-box protein [Nitrospira sp.]|nr:PAS domain S-box protein [Nitrospira sp.]